MSKQPTSIDSMVKFIFHPASSSQSVALSKGVVFLSIENPQLIFRRYICHYYHFHILYIHNYTHALKRPQIFIDVRFPTNLLHISFLTLHISVSLFGYFTSEHLDGWWAKALRIFSYWWKMTHDVDELWLEEVGGRLSCVNFDIWSSMMKPWASLRWRTSRILYAISLLGVVSRFREHSTWETLLEPTLGNWRNRL